jgi:hypothetical protein
MWPHLWPHSARLALRHPHPPHLCHRECYTGWQERGPSACAHADERPNTGIARGDRRRTGRGRQNQVGRKPIVVAAAQRTASAVGDRRGRLQADRGQRLVRLAQLRSDPPDTVRIQYITGMIPAAYGIPPSAICVSPPRKAVTRARKSHTQDPNPAAPFRFCASPFRQIIENQCFFGPNPATGTGPARQR